MVLDDMVGTTESWQHVFEWEDVTHPNRICALHPQQYLLLYAMSKLEMLHLVMLLCYNNTRGLNSTYGKKVDI